MVTDVSGKEGRLCVLRVCVYIEERTPDIKHTIHTSSHPPYALE